MGEFVSKRIVGQTVVEVTLQDNAVSGDGTPTFLGGLGSRFSIYIKWNAGVTNGRVMLETADVETFTGEWVKLHEFKSKSDAEDVLQVDGPLYAVRARITTAVSGGVTPGVTVKLLAHHP